MIVDRDAERTALIETLRATLLVLDRAAPRGGLDWNAIARTVETGRRLLDAIEAPYVMNLNEGRGGAAPGRSLATSASGSSSRSPSATTRSHASSSSHAAAGTTATGARSLRRSSSPRSSCPPRDRASARAKVGG